MAGLAVADGAGSVLIKFLVCSLVGIFLFFVPVSFNGKSTIPLDHIVNLVLKVPSLSKIARTKRKSIIWIIENELLGVPSV